MKRIHSIDFTRGVVMIIMALDHVRDMIHTDSVAQSPTNLATTTPLLFFTRWLTYLCAPAFVFLAGTSAWLSFQRNNDLPTARNFLIKRGIYLIVLEFAVVNSGLFFDPGFHTFIFEVIASIGFGFIVLALLLNRSSKAIGFAGLAIIVCHNLFSLIPFAEGSLTKSILSPLFVFGVFPFSGKVFIMGYPPVPWLGIMLAGFGCGSFFKLAAAKRKSWFVKIGGTALLLFIVVRFVNIYGDSVPWSPQKNGLFTFLSFMNVTKYPPSLLFCLVTLGVMFFMLAFSEGVKNRVVDIALVYGKVPLFYFLVHFFLIHFMLLVILFLQGFTRSQLEFASGSFGRPKGLQSGLPLWAIYFLWAGVVAVLYKPCQWYGNYKAAHKQWWLKYL